jgi:GntR family transcriptional regulator
MAYACCHRQRSCAATLTQEYGVSRDTVRRTVAVPRDEGLVFTIAQRGTYVGPRPSA